MPKKAGFKTGKDRVTRRQKTLHRKKKDQPNRNGPVIEYRVGDPKPELPTIQSN